MDRVIATHLTDTCRVYVWASGAETWQDCEEKWQVRRLPNPTTLMDRRVIDRELAPEVSDDEG